ncbi:hypothetical protein GF376_02300 [Candidatus Peregrinibacteria bacterium]|nr:hypothetical protein [Candidatus Peregrinibacteria bacterium]
MATKKNTPNKRTTNKPKIKTSVGLSRTKPLKENQIKKLQKNISKKEAQKNKSDQKNDKSTRKKPESKIKEQEKLSLWFVPAKISFIFNGIYYLIFAVISFLAISFSPDIISNYFVLPFDLNNYESLYLLEVSAAFALLGSLLFFHAAKEPRKYAWFYFFLILFFLPGAILANIQKMQLNITENFTNFLFFDTILTTVFLGVNLLSIYAYIKTIRSNNK